MTHLEQAIMAAVRRLRLLRYYPANVDEEVMKLLARLVSTPEQLKWLIDKFVDEIGEWHGSAQLRALFTSHFAPADGIEGPDCTIGGYTPDDGEAKSIEAHEERKREALAAGASQKQIAAPVDHEAVMRELEEDLARATRKLKPIIGISSEDRLLSEKWARERGLLPPDPPRRVR